MNNSPDAEYVIGGGMGAVPLTVGNHTERQRIPEKRGDHYDPLLYWKH